MSKKTAFKKFMGILLAVCMVVGLLPMTTYAADAGGTASGMQGWYYIDINLTTGAFSATEADVQNAANWTVTGLSGRTISSIIRESDTSVTIYLSANMAAGDSFTIQGSTAVFAAGTTPFISPLNVSIDVPTPATGTAIATAGTKDIAVTLTTGTYASAPNVQNINHWTLAGASAGGNPIASVTRVDPTHATVTLTNNIAAGDNYTLTAQFVYVNVTVAPFALPLVVTVNADVNDCAIGATKYATLDLALTAVNTGEIITLLDYITDSDGIIINNGKNITFDVKGYNLEVTNAAGAGLEVTNGSVVNLAGTGAFNVTGTTYGVRASGIGSTVTVTNASATEAGGSGADAVSGGGITVNGNAQGGSYGAYAVGKYSTVTVTGYAKGTNGTGAIGKGGGKVIVNGNVEGYVKGAYAEGKDADNVSSFVSVTGNAKGTASDSSGVSASWGGCADIKGYAQGGKYGAYAADANSTVIVNGGAEGTGTNSYGGFASGGGKVTIKGNAQGIGCGAYTTGANSTVTVEGDAIGTANNSHGAWIIGSGSITVDGNAKGGLWGVHTDGGGSITVTGDVTATAAGYGAVVYDGSVTIDGMIMATNYIVVNGTIKNQGNYSATTTKPNYHTYISGTSTVWVKETAAPSGNSILADGNWSGTPRYVSFGQYPQSDATGASTEPIIWRVLDVGNKEAFLLADKVLDYGQWHTSVPVPGPDYWNNCSLRDWLNGSNFGTHSSYFAVWEQGAIVNGTDGKIFLLSESEAQNTNYGFTTGITADAGRQAGYTTYANRHGAYLDLVDLFADYWLRTPVGDNIVRLGYYSGALVNADPTNSVLGIRPALKLDLSYFIFKSDTGTAADPFKLYSVWNNPLLGVPAVNGSTLTVTLMNDAVGITSDGTTGNSSAQLPATTDFVVKVNGSQVTVTNVGGSNDEVILTLQNAVQAGQIVTLDYTMGSNAIMSLFSNEVVDSFTSQSVMNNTSGGTVWSQIAAGDYHSVAIKSDGTLWAWGRNEHGELGDSTIVNRNTPVQIGTDNDWVATSAGNAHTLALKSDGSLWTWGKNHFGQLGTGDTNDKLVPTKIGTDTDWASVTAGSASSYAIKSDGALWAWGCNYDGRLGDGTTYDWYAPIKIGTGWLSVAAGGRYALGIKADHTLWAWGYNDAGQLGIGNTTSMSAPVQVGSSSNWDYITTGDSHSLAIKSDDTLWAWGYNWVGQLGDDTQVDNHTPIQIGSDTSAVAANEAHTLALKTDGTIWGWGQNNDGALGLGNTNTPVSTRTQIGIDSDWDKISAGHIHGYAIKTDGSLWVWGDNEYGQLGDGTTTDKLVPTQIGSSQLPTPAAPTISPNGGNFTGSTKVTLAGSGGTVYYTTDDSSPTTSSTQYTAPFTLSQSATVKAAVYNSSTGWSDIARASFSLTVTQVPSGGVGTPLQSEKLAAQVLDSSGNVIGSITPKLDGSTGTAVVEVNLATLTSAFDKSKADDKGIKTIEVNIPKIDGAKTYEPILPVNFLTSLDATKAVKIETDIATVTVPGNMLTTADAAGAQNVSLIITAGDKNKLDANVQAQIGSRPVIELNLKINGKQTSWGNESAPVTVTVPYMPTADELKDPEHITVWYIDGSGKAVAVPNGRYDPATGKVTFSTTHFSNYAIAFVQKTFDDLGSTIWAKKQIEVLVSKGILKGISEKEYAPKINITRADFLYYLIRTLGVEAEIDGNFKDISSDAYYYKEIGIAKKLGITNGTGNNKFSPDASITRQDMMVLTKKLLGMLKKVKKQGTASDLEKFSDKALVAAYAVDSVATVVKEGLIVGSGNKVNPLGNTTRAEAAAFLYSIYNKYPR